jgi:hypothetical protein
MLKKNFININLLFLAKPYHIMKKLPLLLVFFFYFNGYSQFNELAPWMSQNEAIIKKKELTLTEIKSAFHKYWENRNINEKGSGHKPFMRWEYHWKNLTNKEDYLITPQEMAKAFAQKKLAKSNQNANALRSLPVSNWTPIGPFTHTNTGSWSNGQGRINIITVDPSNANTIYIGAPAGGIWKSTNAGQNWTPLSDNLEQIGVSGIAVDYSNENTIYIATGDKDGADTYSIGVLKSTNGGLTWNPTGLSFSNTSTFAGDLIIHPTNNQILWCATNLGVYKTIDGGNTWAVVQTGNFSKGSIRLKPGDPSTVYAVSNNKFYRSVDTGTTFSNITAGLPATGNRMILDVAPANANYIYILSANTSNGFQGIYKSVDSGTSWIRSATTTNVFESRQSWFDLALAVSSTNAEEIYTGCLNVWKSIDGGATVTKVNNWNAPGSASYSHADIHFLGFFGNKLFCGSDGGIYTSTNGGSDFSSLTDGLQISQFYKIAVSKQSAGKMVGGLQDNGGHAYSGNQWKNYYGADGMDAAVDPINSNKYFGFIQFGGSLHVSTTAGDSRDYSVSAPAAETGTNDSGGNWVTPLAMNSLGELFSGYASLYKLSGNAWGLQSSSPIGIGNLELITIDPSNDNIIYVVNDADLYKSTDRGITFNTIYSAGSEITSVCVNYSNSAIVYITTSGTFGEALKSINGGTTFTSFSEGLPNIAKEVIRHQGRNFLNPLYLGTSLGVYYRDDSMSQWESFDTNLPNVTVTDLEVNLEDNILTAATYGRGIWQTPIPLEVPANDLKLVAIQNPTVNINCNGTTTPVISVKNNGSNPVTAVSVVYTVDGNPLNYTWTGTIAINATQSISLPNFSVGKGIHTISINATITNDAYADNNQSTTTFYVNDSGTLNTVNTFTNASDAELTYTDGLITSQWQRGIRTGSALTTGTNNVYATNLTNNYPNNVKAYLYSKCYNLAGTVNPQIKFKMAFALEQDYDIVYVEYSTNMGENWTVLGELGPNWYNSDRLPGADCNNCPGAQWTGTDTTLREYFYPLTNLIGQSNVIFRLVFHTDPEVVDLGVVIDDFVIEGVLSTDDFELKNIAIYPNPSAGIFNISSGQKAIEKVEVYDVSGKIVFSSEKLAQTNTISTIDLGDLSNGVYFIKVSADNQKTVKRIIKN